MKHNMATDVRNNHLNTSTVTAHAPSQWRQTLHKRNSIVIACGLLNLECDFNINQTYHIKVIVFYTSISVCSAYVAT